MRSLLPRSSRAAAVSAAPVLGETVHRWVPLESFESEYHPVFGVDSSGAMRYCNRAAGALLGRIPDECLGKPCWRVARFRMPDGAPFCSAECPVAREIRAEHLTPFHSVTGRSGRLASVRLSLLTFPIPGGRGRRSGILHILLPERPAPREARDGSAVSSGRGQVFLNRLAGLTKRESEVLGLMARGCDTRSISTQLRIRPVTVRNHVECLLRKLGAHSRLEAVVALLSQDR